MGQRSKARVCAMQMLYQREWSGEEPTRVIEDFWTMRNGTPAVRAMAERLFVGAERERESIDLDITSVMTNWELGRLAAIERNVLRLGAYELKCEDATPSAVIIDEAIEISKRYGEADSSSFVNGILDALKRKYRDQAANA
ncbi:MAG: transcription antitermination factor NusB [Vicinamibacteria bacterium]|nr:transcription antitermination factor NusB [Vicinamibacteria bacterium]